MQSTCGLMWVQLIIYPEHLKCSIEYPITPCALILVTDTTLNARSE